MRSYRGQDGRRRPAIAAPAGTDGMPEPHPDRSRNHDSTGGGRQVSVYNAVDGLCKKVPILCAARETLGIPRKIMIVFPAPSWANTIHRL